MTATVIDGDAGARGKRGQAGDIWLGQEEEWEQAEIFKVGVRNGG